MQAWDPQRYARNARFVTELGGAVLDLLAPQPGERILDLGCGDGPLTRRIADSGADVVGVDSAPRFVEAARHLGLDARLMDGHALSFEREFDAVFSNAALHWMKDADAVIAGVARALRPGGRFVGEFGGFTNVAAIVVAFVAALNRRGLDGRAAIPWYYPSPEEYREKLEAHGFTVESIELIPRPTPLPGHISGWLDTFGESFFSLVPQADRAALKQEVIDLLEPALCDGKGNWLADYVRLRFRAHLGR